MDVTMKKMLVPGAVALGSTLALLAARAVIFRVLHRWASKTETRLDDIVIAAFKIPSLYWAPAIGLSLGIALSGFPERTVATAGRIIHVLVILSFTIATANLSGKLLTDYVEKSHLPFPTTGLANGLLKGLILVIGSLVILSFLGISITPLITALGVGGLAVALGLQDTLANLFAGVHILMERSVRIGDFVRLENGQEGYVEDITWRTTRIRMLPNNMVVIPNNKLAQSIVTNYYLPDRRMAVPILVGVSYASDPDHVERVLLDEATTAAAEVPGLLADPAPVARFIPGFGESSLDFTLVCHVREVTDQYPVQSELRKRIFKRFQQEGIEIPFPQRTVHVNDDREGKR